MPQLGPLPVDRQFLYSHVGRPGMQLQLSNRRSGPDGGHGHMRVCGNWHGTRTQSSWQYGRFTLCAGSGADPDELHLSFRYCDEVALGSGLVNINFVYHAEDRSWFSFPGGQVTLHEMPVSDRLFVQFGGWPDQRPLPQHGLSTPVSGSSASNSAGDWHDPVLGLFIGQDTNFSFEG